MGEEMAADFALAAVREDGLWSVVPLPPAAAEDLESTVACASPATRRPRGDRPPFLCG